VVVEGGRVHGILTRERGHDSMARVMRTACHAVQSIRREQPSHVARIPSLTVVLLHSAPHPRVPLLP